MKNWVVTILLVHHHFHLEPHNLVAPYFPLLFSLSQQQYLPFNLQTTSTPVMVLCQTSVTLYFMRTETIIDPKSTDHFTCYQPSFFFLAWKKNKKYNIRGKKVTHTNIKSSLFPPTPHSTTLFAGNCPYRFVEGGKLFPTFSFPQWTAERRESFAEETQPVEKSTDYIFQNNIYCNNLWTRTQPVWLVVARVVSSLSSLSLWVCVCVWSVRWLEKGSSLLRFLGEW